MLRQLSYNLLNIVSRLLNLCLFWVIANTFGASQSTDWFFFLYGFVYFIIATLFYSIECALVPSWPSMTAEERNEFFYICLVGGVILSSILLISGFFIALFVPQLFGFTNPFSLQETLVFSFLLFLQPLFAYVSALYSSLLQAQGNYFWPITHLSFRATGALFILSFLDSWGIASLVVAYTVGEFLRMVVLSLVGRNAIGRLKPVRQINLNPFRKYFFAIGWMALMVLASASNAYIDFVMVGHSGEGNATLVEYAGRLRWMPMLALSSILTVFLGDWSRLDGKSLPWSKVYAGAWQVAFFGALLCSGLIVTRQYWLPLVFTANSFDANQLQTLSHLMLWYLGGASLMIGGTVLSRGFLVWNRFRVMSILSLISVFVNIVLNIVFISLLGVIGVAISTAGLDAVMLGIFVWWGVKIGKEQKNQVLSTA